MSWGSAPPLHLTILLLQHKVKEKHKKDKGISKHECQLHQYLCELMQTVGGINCSLYEAEFILFIIINLNKCAKQICEHQLTDSPEGQLTEEL